MTTKQIAKQILEILAQTGSASTSYLIGRFGDQTTAALDLLGNKIIRVRGSSATVYAA
jgi:hypothetical protein